MQCINEYAIAIYIYILFFFFFLSNFIPNF